MVPFFKNLRVSWQGMRAVDGRRGHTHVLMNMHKDISSTLGVCYQTWGVKEKVPWLPAGLISEESSLKTQS